MKDLASLKRERGSLRSSITKSHAKICAKGDLDTSVLSAILECMRLRFEELTAKNNEIFDLLSKENAEASEPSESVLEEEIEDVDKYVVMYYQCKAVVEKRLQDESLGDSGDGANSAASAGLGSLHGDRQYRLPALKLREFDGSLKEWLPFWGQFEKIHEDQKLQDIDKLAYLNMSMKPNSPAKQLVESYPATALMYPKVIQALKDRYGRTDLLTELYIRELITLILENTVNKEKMSTSLLYDNLQCHLRNLESLGVTMDSCAPILMPLVSSSLPQELLQLWERSVVPMLRVSQPGATSKEHLCSLMDFLKTEVEGAQKLKLAQTTFGLSPTQAGGTAGSVSNFRKKDVKEVRSTATDLVNSSKSNSCLFCDGKHEPQDCRTQMSVEKRLEQVKLKRACFSCWKFGHRSRFCRNRPKCTICKENHFTLVCEKGKKNGPDNKSCSLASSTKHCGVLMQTLIVDIEGPLGRTRKVRALVDTGSQRSYVLTRTAEEMDYLPVRTESIQHALFGGKVTKEIKHKVYTLHLAYDNYRCDFEVLDQDKICETIPSVPKGPWLQELKQRGIVIEDVDPGKEVEILIGSDVAGRLYTGDIIVLDSKLVAMETHLGWTLSGKLPEQTTEGRNLAMIVTSLFLKDSNITDLWSLDVLGITDPLDKVSKAEMEQETLKHFRSTVQVVDDRFEVRLPFIKDHPPISDNYRSAYKRLQTTVKKLNQDGWKAAYQAVLDDWMVKGVIEEVPIEEVSGNAHYLPHRPVVKYGSTTPIRPVFDASAKEGDKCSLNQCLETGPNLIEKIPACLARFRGLKYGISGDIEKAFLQIGINKKDRDYLRFLWQSEDGQIKVLRHCRVVFGATCSPFLLEACLHHHLDTVMELCKTGESPYPVEFVEVLKHSFYVDNCLTSVESLEEVEEFITVASSVMLERKFLLRGWETTGEISSKPTNVLGLNWSRLADTLSINMESLVKMNYETITKKVMLSAAHRLFDPIGMVCCTAIVPKLLIQETWRMKCSWNEVVPQDIQERFRSWMDEIYYLSDVEIPRWILDSREPNQEMALHIFSDACKTSYAAAVFLRTECNGTVTLRLLGARARVAPITKTKEGMTIPRLELLAATIAVRLYTSVITDFQMSNLHATFWTDATTVLAWIHRQEPWDVYVMNRVKEIRTLSENCEWKHVPGEINPADLPSRGCSPKTLVKSRWWEGPHWLRGPPESWPQSEMNYDEGEVNREKKKTVVSSMLSDNSANLSEWYNRYFSQYTKIVRMIAWILRFQNNSLVKRKGLQHVSGELTTNEYQSAEKRLFLLVQKESLSEDKLTSLVTFVDPDGLVRIKTKVSNLQDSQDFCLPIVLLGKHPIVQKLIINMHVENCHVGLQTLLSILRQRFWIVGGRRVVRSVLNTCVVCKRFTAKKSDVVPTPLPENRVRDAKVFEISGCDLFGPLYIKSEGGTSKVWVCLFTCAVYRAVHLELVTSLSTDSFVQALRRFCSFHGRVKIMYSDQGSNFMGFDSACDKLDWTVISQYSSSRRIEWRFNPPSSPWWGGWWERLIGIVKGLLKRVLGHSLVNYETMLTLLSDLKSIINNRPLTYMSEDASDLVVLTPAMFLHELEDTGVPEIDLISPSDLRVQFKRRKDLRRQLRERFKGEYLGQLKLKSSSKKEHCIKVGDVVLIGDDNVKRMDWPIAQVIQLVPGTDGHVRVVKLKTSGSGVLTRPIQRVYPLEFHCCPDDMTSETCPNDMTPIVSQDTHSEITEVVSPFSDPNDHVQVDSKQPSPVRVNRSGRNVKRPVKLDL